MVRPNLGERLVGGQNHVNALEGPDAIAFSPRIDEKSADAAFAKLDTNFGYICSFRLAARPLGLAVSQATPPAAGRQLSHTPFTLSDFLTQNGMEAGLAKRCGASGGRETYPGQRA